MKVDEDLQLDVWRRAIPTYARIMFRCATKLHVAVTNKCNMRCKTCGIWKIYQREPELANKELRIGDYEEFFRAHGAWNWISFTGGEPFLRDDLIDIMLTACERCEGLHTISIISNGYLTEKIVDRVQEFLSETRLPSFHFSVSLDGLPHIHDLIRGRIGSFKHAVATFRKLQKINDNRLKVHFEYVISKFNQGKLRELINHLSLTPNDFILTIAQNAFFYHNRFLEVKPAVDALNSDIEWFLSHFKIRSSQDIAQWLFLKNVIKRRRIPCVAGKSSFYMNPYGKIFPCIFVQRQIGAIERNVINTFEPDPNCRCYTPCESYLSLLLHLPEAFALSIVA